ncbi:hypothetical protein PAPHI01_0649 [Pancytospora philotis]|nr:hypothetical protein PAPHI01_0649 [Pancytospora philotis]
MDRRVELMGVLLAAELPVSVLFIAESMADFDPVASYAVARALFLLNYKTRVRAFIEETPALLAFHELGLLYLRAGGQLKAESSRPLSSLPGYARLSQAAQPGISHRSLRNYFFGLEKKEQIRKRLLVQSFMDDCRNVEALATLYSESLCELDEVEDMIESYAGAAPAGWSLPEYREFLAGLFKRRPGRAATVLCPFVLGAHNRQRFEEQNSEAILSSAIGTLEAFPECEASYEALGLYYLTRQHYNRAQSCFAEAIERNKCRGLPYLYSGMALSAMRKTDKAIAMLEMADAIMCSSLLPSFYLAFEYQQMNNFPKAMAFYVRCLDRILEQQTSTGHEGDAACFIKRNKRNEGPSRALSARETAIINRAVYCFIYNENYDTAARYIKVFGLSNILKVFCLLFTGDIEGARLAMADCAPDSCFYATSGFLHHLADGFESAVKDYDRSIGMDSNDVVLELMHMALNNIRGAEKNHAFDYTNSLFDSLEFKKRCLLL